MKIMKIFLIFVSTMLILTCLFTPVQTLASEKQIDIALRKKVTVSDTENNTFSSDKLVDGNTDRNTETQSRWASNTNISEKWVSIDLSSSHSIKTIVLDWERRNATKYKVIVSNDNKIWTDVYSSNAAPVQRRQYIVLDNKISARYVKLVINKFKKYSEGIDWSNISLFEIEVYEEEYNPIGDTPKPKERKVVPKVDGNTYYVDSTYDKGGDGSLNKPFNNLESINKLTLSPGDTISLKKGSVFDNQQLVPKGSGTLGKPILINSYGVGNRPIINAGGLVLSSDGSYKGFKEAILIENLEHVFLTGLEITNDDDFNANWHSDVYLNQKEKDVLYPKRLGVHITIDERAYHNPYQSESSNIFKNITIDDCYVHDVDGNENRGANKVDGGIGVEVLFYSSNKNYPIFDGVYIQNNHIRKVDRTGIKGIRLTDLTHQYNPKEYNDDAENPVAGDNTRYTNIRNHNQAQKNFVVNYNTLVDIGGDGIIACETKGAIVENNSLSSFVTRGKSANAGIWAWNAFNTAFRFNEVSKGPTYNQDGCAFDSDYWSAGTIFEYNYSHDNPMGFMLLMGTNDTDIIRYNVSDNDGFVLRHVAAKSATTSYIYNNVFIYDGKSWVFNPDNNSSVTMKNWEFYNNIFYNTNSQYSSNWGSNVEWGGVSAANNIVYEASGEQGKSEIPNAFHENLYFVNLNPSNKPSTFLEKMATYKIKNPTAVTNKGIYVDAIPVTSHHNKNRWNHNGNRNLGTDIFGTPITLLPSIGIQQIN